jgi:hypothetical protein
MFHYRVLGCLGAVFPGGRYHKLLHSVNKLLQAWFCDENSCRLFTNCCNLLQLIKILGPGILTNCPAARKNEVRSGSAHPPLPWAPACHMHGTG